MHCVTNIILILNSKHSTALATKKMSCIPDAIRTGGTVTTAALHLVVLLQNYLVRWGVTMYYSNLYFALCKWFLLSLSSLSPVSSACLVQCSSYVQLCTFVCSKGLYPCVKVFVCLAGDSHSKPAFLMSQMRTGKTSFWLCFLNTRGFALSLSSRYEKSVNHMMNIKISLK